MSSSIVKSLTAVFVIAIMLTSVAGVADSSEADGSTAFDITYTLKGSTHTVHFDGPVDKVIVFGYAMTLTVLDAGLQEKVYATDKYGKAAYEDKGITNSSVEIATNMSSSNVDSINSQIIQAESKGDISKDDAIILTTYEANSETIRAKLDEAGFTHVLYYGSMATYSDLVKCVGEVEKVIGSTANLAENMKNTYDSITTTVKDAALTDAIYIRYSSANKVFGYGNTGSLAVTLITAAGGNNLGYTSGSSESTIYNESAIVQKVKASSNCVIFLDSGYLTSNDGSPQKFVDQVFGGDWTNVKIVIMEKPWNNYDPESADGIKEIAGVLHPDLVHSDAKIYTGESGGNDSIMIYAGAALAVIVIAALAVFLIRRRG